MTNIFQNILVSKPKRSVFDLSYENKLSFDMGDLVPIYSEYVIPGDKFRVNTEVFLRFAPMVFPVMHRVNCYVHFFFVPFRLIWDDFQDFITGGEDGTLQPVFPRRKFFLVDAQQYFGIGSIADYLGYNFADYTYGGSSVAEYSLLPARAYQFIYNEYYRDQNLTPEVDFSRASGDSTSFDALIKGTSYPKNSTGAYQATYDLFTLRKRAWEKDYFTSALPWVQRGVASQIPITLDTSQLVFADKANSTAVTQGSTIDKAYMADQSTPPGDDVYIRTDGTISTGTKEMYLGSDGNGGAAHTHNINAAGLNAGVKISQNANGVVITPPTINELRLAEHIQKWLEKNARGGARYIEQILSHFGVRVPDFRLDRPEYLGGGKSPVVISEVLQTSSTDAVSPQGSMAGHGYSVGNKNSFKYSFDEHGIVMGIISVLPRTSYQQGISRHFLKFDKFDYAWPEFAHLGEQSVYKAEIFNDMLGSWDDVFGYQERYAEYKYRSSEVHGDFKSSLDSWHLGRKFSNAPQLNTSFVESDPSTRIFASPTGQHLWCQAYHSVRAKRCLPKHAIPSL